MKKKLSLSAKTAAIFGAALAAISSNQKISTVITEDSFESNVKDIKVQAKKPMPVLKLNLNNPEESKFVAGHVSHASHRSHASHSSHWSHRSFVG
jgi:hypothetical protein